MRSELAMLGAKNAPRRTTANRAESIVVTRYGSTEPGRLSRLSAAGNLAGNFPVRFPNLANLKRKFSEFESSPGHQIFFIYQTNITLP
jgi:hypothetical protein